MGMGGTDQQIAQLSSHLSALGHEVSVASLLPTGQMGKELENTGVSVHHLSMTRGAPDPRGVARMAKLLRHKKPDILNCFLIHANLVGRITGWMRRVPAIVTSIRNADYCEGIECGAHRLTNWMDDACVANSAIVAQHMVEQGMVSAEKMHVVYNCIDLDTYRPDAAAQRSVRDELEIRDTTFLWVAVGRIEEQKDYPTLLKAVDQIPQQRVHVAVAGKGSLEDKVHSIQERLGLSSRVSFLGVRRDVPRLLAAADGLVLSSISEGLPNVVMEALASATPVVATDVGGVTELVQDKKTGFVVSPRDPSCLAQAMEELMNVPDDRRAAMGREGREWIRAKCSVDEVVDQWLALYNDVLANSW